MVRRGSERDFDRRNDFGSPKSGNTNGPSRSNRYGEKDENKSLRNAGREDEEDEDFDEEDEEFDDEDEDFDDEDEDFDDEDYDDEDEDFDDEDEDEDEDQRGQRSYRGVTEFYDEDVSNREEGGRTNQFGTSRRNEQRTQGNTTRQNPSQRQDRSGGNSTNQRNTPKGRK